MISFLDEAFFSLEWVKEDKGWHGPIGGTETIVARRAPPLDSNFRCRARCDRSVDPCGFATTCSNASQRYSGSLLTKRKSASELTACRSSDKNFWKTGMDGQRKKNGVCNSFDRYRLCRLQLQDAPNYDVMVVGWTETLRKTVIWGPISFAATATISQDECTIATSVLSECHSGCTTFKGKTVIVEISTCS